MCESSYDFWRTQSPGGWFQGSSLLKLQHIPRILVFNRRHIFISLKLGDASASVQMPTKEADLCPSESLGPPTRGRAAPQDQSASLRCAAHFPFSQGFALTFARGGKRRIPVLALRLCKYAEPGQVWINVRQRGWPHPLLQTCRQPRAERLRQQTFASEAGATRFDSWRGSSVWLLDGRLPAMPSHGLPSSPRPHLMIQQNPNCPLEAPFLRSSQFALEL